ncbi:AAA family ATPase [Xanthomarina gelatinilytica]|uniref:AAA family ATPase n=1 Tax=Xanthomarina gelatinilytica TaxID=1137281 RepID=UPI003AA81440
MILEFSVENFLSFKDLQTLSMVGVKSFKEHEETNTFILDDKHKILKSAAIYGNNASGKSNFIDAIGFMRLFVQFSFRDALSDEEEKRKIPYERFKLSTETDNEPSFFEMIFTINGKKYRYGFEITEDEVISEWLFHTTSKETFLFKRDGEKFEINKSSFDEGVDLTKRTRPNVLFLTLVAQLNGQISNEVVDWFKDLNVISGIHDRGYKRYTINKLKKDNKFSKWLSSFVEFLEISKLTTDEESVNQSELEELKEKEKDEELINFLSSLQKLQAKQTKRDKLITWHRKYDENNILVDTVPFDFESNESEGTKKLIYLLGPWFDTLNNGKVLLVDELDSRLHSSLVLKLVEFFHKENTTNAQLIFAVHNTSILNYNVLRRDQIWFIDKNQFGCSELYSLADFKSEKVRKKSAFDKNYLEGKYGAIPFFSESNPIIQD